MKKKYLTLLCISFMVNLGCTKENLDVGQNLDYKVEKFKLFNTIKSIKKSTENSNLNAKINQVNTLVFTEEEKNATLQSSINVLNSQEITNDVIIEEFGDLTNPEIVLTALAITRIVDEAESGRNIIDLETGYNYCTDTYIDLNLLNSNNHYYSREPSVLDCAMDALGIPAGLLVGSAKSLSQKALLKAAKKLATRTLGWVGASIAIYEFGDCMEWW